MIVFSHIDAVYIKCTYIVYTIHIDLCTGTGVAYRTIATPETFFYVDTMFLN